MTPMNWSSLTPAEMDRQALQECILEYQRTIKKLISALRELEAVQLKQDSLTRHTIILLLDDLMADLQALTHQLIQQ